MSRRKANLMTTTPTARRAQAGFSLIELMVAMAITLIVTGAIFGLLSSGQSAFKVQPERTDRQQNIRSAMDLIIRDVGSAGVGMPPFVQTFTRNLGGTGMTGPFGATDQLEILANTAGFPNEEVCAGTTPSNGVILKKAAIDFGAGTNVMVLFKDGGWNVRQAQTFSTATGDPPCTGSSHVAVGLSGSACGHAPGLGNAGDGSLNPVACGMAAGSTAPCCTVDSVGFGEVIRYRVALSGGLPNLERSVNGGTFQVVARGIEDLQVQYMTQALTQAGGASLDQAPAVDVTATDYTTLITEVRVTLSARAATTRIQGATYATGTANAALRGALTAQISPRQALATLTTESPVTPKWN